MKESNDQKKGRVFYTLVPVGRRMTGSAAEFTERGGPFQLQLPFMSEANTGGYHGRTWRKVGGILKMDPFSDWFSVLVFEQFSEIF